MSKNKNDNIKKMPLENPEHYNVFKILEKGCLINL